MKVSLERSGAMRRTAEDQRLHEDAVMPMYRREGDSGFDLHSLEEAARPGQSRLISTGIAVEIPKV